MPDWKPKSPFKLLRRFEHIEIKGEREQIKWKGNFLMRALEELPLSF
ncbi:hypothetical protein CHCC14809_0358 [Bacillus licheniformis]|nr:hypothetical protein CHCC15087_4060 [Bacillus licheniformis]TWM76725.1 hypothetical protein CHCC14809_0358 [Bacillus licheniformis]